MQYTDFTSDQTCLNKIIDLGSKPLSAVIDNISDQKVADKPQNDSKKKQKKKQFSDLLFLPPIPNDSLEVITYAECRPSFVLRDY